MNSYVNRKIFVQLTLMCFAFLSVVSLGCSGQKKLTDNGTEIIYDGKTVTEADAKKLNAVLNESGFTDGEEKTVELQKEDDVWQFRMVSQDGVENDPEMISSAVIMCLELSGEFDGEPFAVDLCDENLKSKKKVTGLKGVPHEIGGVLVYLDQVSEDCLTSLKPLLQQEEVTEALFHFQKQGDHFNVRFAVLDVVYNSSEFDSSMTELANSFSKDVFEGAPVTLMLCNDYLETKKTLQSN